MVRGLLASHQQTRHSFLKRFSVIVCSRNPRADYIAQALAAIGEQSLPRDSWELVVVDSASSPALQERPIPFPSETRFITVKQPGVFRARMAGVLAAQSEWLVFVDDDNILDSDYLIQASSIIDQMPDLTLFCGRISGVFETPPPGWLKPLYRQLAVIDFPIDSFANDVGAAAVPCWTAGMVVRRQYGLEYFKRFATDPFRQSLNRCEDVDFIQQALAMHRTCGLFRSLHMRHLIPSERMTEGYIKRISSETAYNMAMLRWRGSQAGIRDVLRPCKHIAVSLLKPFSVNARIRLASAVAELRGTFMGFLSSPCASQRC